MLYYVISNEKGWAFTNAYALDVPGGPFSEEDLEGERRLSFVKAVSKCLAENSAGRKSLTLVTFRDVLRSSRIDQALAGDDDPEERSEVVAMVPQSDKQIDAVWKAEVAERVGCYPQGINGGILVTCSIEEEEWYITLSDRAIASDVIAECVGRCANELDIDLEPFPDNLMSYARERLDLIEFFRTIRPGTPRSALTFPDN